MKQMTCRQLGGACDKTFTAESFEKMGTLSREHGMEMIKRQDVDHLIAMEKMKELMQDPDAMKNWMDEKKRLFDSLPHV